jgi:hypothetical protein
MRVRWTLPAKASPPAGSESCVARREDPGLRSVDSEHAGREIEPRKEDVVGADAVGRAEGHIDTLERRTRRRARRVGPTGVGEQGMQARVLQEPGRPRHLRRGGPRQSAGRYRPSEGNEARREGWRGVRAPRRTDEAGEPTRGTPWRKGGAGMQNRAEERWERHRARKLSQRNSNG